MATRKTPAKAPAKRATTATRKVQERKLYALQATPRGKALFTYMMAAMSALDMFKTSGRKAVPVASLASFFQSRTAINHHKANGNMEVKDGMVKLTVTGYNYFNGRLTGSTVGQDVDTAEMKALIEGIKHGKLKEKTARFAVDTKFKQVTIKA